MSARSPSRLYFFLILILLLAFALRVALVIQGKDLPIKWDERAYARRGHELFQNVSAYDDVIRPPVYPFFLAIVFNLIGSTRFIVGIAQALVSTFLVATIFTLARILFARREIALLAALIAALYLEFITLARILMTETLFMTLSVLGMTILFHAWKTHSSRASSRQHAWEFFPAGIVLALAALTRELLSYFVVLVLPVWLLLVSYKTPRGLALNFAALAFGLALVLAPWVIRNYALEERFILSTTHSEIDLLRDNWRVELVAQGLPLKNRDGTMAQRVRKALRNVPPDQRSAFVLTRAAETMWLFPRAWIGDKFSRLKSFWRPFALEARVVRLEDIPKVWRNLLQQVVSYSAVILLLLGTLGIIVARDDAPKLLIALYILYSLVIFLMTHYLPRFRLPLLVLLIPYAAFALVQIFEWLRAPHKRAWLAQKFARHRVRALAASLVLGLFLVLTRI